MADSHQPNKPNPPPLPPRPLPSNDPTTHQLSAPRLPPRAPVGNLTKLSDGNLPCEVQASTSDSASKSASDSTHPPPQITPVPLPDQALPLDSIPEPTLPSPTKLPHSDDLEQAPHVNYYDGASLPISQPSRQRGDSASDFSLSLDSFVQCQDAQPAESDCRRTNSYDEKRAEIERLEVSEFIRRSSRYLNEVNFQLVESEATSATPALYDFRSSAGDIDWVGFCNTYAAAQLERHFPNSLRSSTNRAPLSMGQLKAQASRSYVTILPVVWDLISGNRLSSIYRWENPRRTSFYLFTYYLLWAMDMIPSFIVGYGLYMLIERQLNPPTISQLRPEANQRQQLGKQAEAIESEEFLDIKHGTVTKGVLGNSMVFAGVALGSNLSAPGTGKAATDPPPSSSHTLPKTSDYRSMYSFTRRLYSDHGQEIQTMLEDLADMGEKIRNLYLWRRPRACWRTSFMLGCVLLYTLAISQKWLVKNFLGWLGMEFFFLLGFTDKHRKFRKILNPIWLLLYDIPTDAEFAIQVLQQQQQQQQRGKTSHHQIEGRANSKLFKRHHHHQPSHILHKKSTSSVSSLSDPKRHDSADESAPTICAAEPTRPAGLTSSDRSVTSAVRHVSDPETWKRWTHKVAHGGNGVLSMAKKMYAGGENSHPEDNPNALDCNDLLDSNVKTFAILNGRVPGNLAVQRDQICFEPLKGFRSKTAQMKSALMKPASGDSIPSRTRGLSTPCSSSSSSLSSTTHAIKARRTPSVEDVIRHENPARAQAEDDFLDLAGPGTAAAATTTPTSPDLVIRFAQITKIKKVKRSILFGLGFRISDGIEFYLDNSTVLSFDNILNRDEYFNQLLLLCCRPVHP